MDMSAPHAPFLSQTDAKVLSTLAGTTRPLTGREIARLVEMAQNGVWRALQRLTSHGLVAEQEAGGSALLYTLNRDHLATDAVLSLIRLRSTLVERIKSRFQSWEIQPAHASIFGSAARGDGDTASDIDIFVVRPKGIDGENEHWRDQINTLADSVLQWTGNHAGISEVPQADVARLKKERPPIVEELARDSILLVGPSASELFSSKRRQ